MLRCLLQPRDRIFAKGYGSWSFAKNMSINISKNLSYKYSQKFFGYDKQSVTDALKTTSKKVIQKTAEVTRDLIGNKIGNRITKSSRSSPQNNSETITNEHDKKYLKKNIYLQKKDKKLLIV